MAELPQNLRDLFEGRNMAHVATLMPDGSPHTVPVWIAIEGDRLAFFTQTASRKARNVAADPRVAISIADRHNPYRMAQVRGRVTVTVEGEAALAIMDRMALRYTGKPFPLRRGIALLVEPEKVFDLTLPFEPPPPGD